MTQESKTTEKERREFFRIRDRMGVRLVSFTPEEREKIIERYEQDRTRLGLSNYLNLEREYGLPRFKQIEVKHPEIAEYLRGLEDRVETIARVVGLREADNGLDAPSHKVEIGGGGLRVGTQQQMPAGTLVYVTLVLFPQRTHVVAIGEVVGSDTDPEDEIACPYYANINFTRIEEEDRETIFKHVQDLQFRSLRHRPAAEE